MSAESQNTACLNLAGRKGQDTPVDVSHAMVVFDVVSGTVLSLNKDGENRR